MTDKNGVIMPNRIQKVLTGGRRALIVGVFLALTAPVAEAQLVVYDDFAAPRIDETRWLGRQLVTRSGGTGSLLEIQREVTNAESLVLQTRVVGGTGSGTGLFTVDNALAFRHPNALSEITFDVTVRGLDVTGCAMESGTEASARGVFPLFNDGIGDIIAIIGVTRSSVSSARAAELDAVASLVHRTPDGDIVLGVVSLGSVTQGQNVKLRTRWDAARNRVRFGRDAEAMTGIEYTNPVVSSPGKARKYLAATSTVSDCAEGGSAAAVVAAFDNVRVNP
jgi:hypothetical protein